MASLRRGMPGRYFGHGSLSFAPGSINRPARAKISRVQRRTRGAGFHDVSDGPSRCAPTRCARLFRTRRNRGALADAGRLLPRLYCLNRAGNITPRDRHLAAEALLVGLAPPDGDQSDMTYPALAQDQNRECRQRSSTVRSWAA